MQTRTVVTTAACSVVALGLDAIYFDYRRRNDPEFRKALRREKKRHAKVQKQQADAASAAQREQIAKAVMLANLEGLPVDVDDKEPFFMNEVAHGEALCQQGPERALEAALCFYKALKVYPQPRDLISIYDKTVPKHVLEILAEMIAIDGSIRIGGTGEPGVSASVGVGIGVGVGVE